MRLVLSIARFGTERLELRNWEWICEIEALNRQFDISIVEFG